MAPLLVLAFTAGECERVVFFEDVLCIFFPGKSITALNVPFRCEVIPLVVRISWWKTRYHWLAAKHFCAWVPLAIQRRTAAHGDAPCTCRVQLKSEFSFSTL